MEAAIAHIVQSKVEMEPCTAFTVYPWWEPPAVTIPSSKGAIKAHDKTFERARDHNWAVVYCDGSEKQGKVGSAAVLINPQFQLTFSMGDSNTSTIFAAELFAIHLALYLVMALGLIWGGVRRNLTEPDWDGETGERLLFPGNHVEPTGYRDVGLEC